MNHELRVILVTKRSRTAMKGFAKAKEDNGMMNIKDVLSPGEEVLFGTQQHRFVSPTVVIRYITCRTRDLYWM
jgi:hypothetical protein